MTQPSELRLPLAHLTLAAQAWGDRHAPPLLALHGWLDNAASFALLAPKLIDRFRVIALELPGHGHSGHYPAGARYHYIDYVCTVLAAADALELDHYHLLGHSLGAGIAAMVAAARPERLDRLLLIEGLGPLGDDGSATLDRFRDALAPPPRRRSSSRTFDDVEQPLQARCLASGMAADLARPLVERGLIAVEGGWQWRSDPRLTRPSPLRLAESQVHALLRGIDAPTSLLLAQPRTPHLPREPMLARAGCIRHIRVSEMNGSHHLHLEHPAAVAAWIEEGTR